jgi:hypothetical protein
MQGETRTMNMNTDEPVRRARHAGPIKDGDAPVDDAVIEAPLQDAVQDAPQDAPQNPVEDAADAEVLSRLERLDDSPARVRNWKRDLLDLTLRNPLLNMPRTQKVLDLVVPPGLLPSIDDAVHAGRKLRLSSGLDASGRKRVDGIDSHTPLAHDELSAVFRTSRTLFSQLDDEKHRKQLRAMKREAESLEQETGSNYLYLTLGTLVHTRPDGREARAPLFLMPVRLTGGLSFTPYFLAADGDDLAQPNLCLLQWFQTTQGLDLTELSSPAIDDSGLAIEAVFEGIRRQLAEAELPYRLEESVSLAILRFSTFQIWKDIDSNWRSLLSNPVVRHLVERPGETFVEPAGEARPTIDEAALRLPIAADGSQMAAVVRATSGQSFVLEGPPGTGKSQTITNLIAHALTEGKTVLFVAEKQAALEVVKRRLDAIGLGAFSLELHGAKQSMNTIREQLRESLRLRVATDPHAWALADTRLRAAIAELDRHPTRVHSPNALGYTAWSAYDALASLGEGPTAAVPTGWLTTTPDESPTIIARDFREAAQRFGLRPAHPWLVVGATDPARLQVAPVTDSLRDLAAVRPRLDELSPEARLVLGDLRPATELPVASRLLDARSRGLLPPADALAAIDRTSWREASDALRTGLADYLERHAAVLADASAAAIEAPRLDEWAERSTALDGAWFLPELRRRSIRSALRPLLRAGFEPSGKAVTPLLVALQAARSDAQELQRQASALAGLVLPAGWQPYSPDAKTILDTAVRTSLGSVWLAKRTPRAWGWVSSGTGAGAGADDAPGTTDADAAIVRDIDASWNRWLSAVGATGLTVRQWAHGRDWVSAWATDEVSWLIDVRATGLLQLQRFTETRRQLEHLRELGLAGFSTQLATGQIEPTDASEALMRGLATASLEERLAAANLDTFDGDAQDRHVSAYRDQGALVREQLRGELAAELLAARPFDADELRGEVAELARQIERKRGGLAFREVARRYPRALTSIVPVFLMSPGSVAHFLDPDSIEFDLVIFDEASQIRVPQAIGAMGRGKAVIVVGDSKQMPPTRIMQVDATGPDTPAPERDEPLVVEDLESILTESVESGLPQLWLNWHYRSQDESLIAFSNAAYYGNKLVSLPSPRSGAAAVAGGSGASAGAGGTGLGWRRVDGTFDRGRTRTNEVEAQAIVDEIVARLRAPATMRESIGVVCFNVQQRDLILDKLEDSTDPVIQKALLAAPGSELFVKNLENVQGDERDTILFSLAFSKDPATGILPLNFGPLNLPGGERRLNVAVTRAKRQVVLFSSFDAADIQLTRSRAQGIADLKSYLEFAETRSAGALPGGGRGGAQDAVTGNQGRFVDELAAALRDRGLEVETGLGLSSFTVDLAVRHRGASSWAVAVMVDGPGWASRPTVSDRDGAPNLLVDVMSWPAVIRAWLPAWIRDRSALIARIVVAVDHPASARLSDADAVEAARDASKAADRAAADARAERAFPTTASTSTLARELPVFEPADDTAVYSQSKLDNLDAVPIIETEAASILEVEGPIPVDRLVSTIARRFDYSRVGDAKRELLQQTVRGAFAISPDDFAWPAGLDASTWRGARRTSSTAVRPVTDVSPQEISNAIVLLLAESLSIDSDELLRETASVLGYSRLTESTRAWIERGLELALSQNRVQRQGSRLVRASTRN